MAVVSNDELNKMGPIECVLDPPLYNLKASFFDKSWQPSEIEVVS